MAQTTTVREMRGFAVVTHYLDPDDESVTLCGIGRADTNLNFWPLALANCTVCALTAGERKVGP